jgi:hypothetical protein
MDQNFWNPPMPGAAQPTTGQFNGGMPAPQMPFTPPLPQTPQMPQAAFPPQMPMQPQMPGGMPQQAMPGASPVMPQYFLPDEEQLRAEFANSGGGFGGGGSDIPFVRFLNPQGGASWENVSPPYEYRVRLYLAPAWAAGKSIFRPSRSHFWISAAKPRGASIACPGPDTCLVCQARDQIFKGADEAAKSRAREIGRVRLQFYYNVFMLDLYEAHFDRTHTKFRPFILPAGKRLHDSIHNIITARGGVINIVDPYKGRPLFVSKRKKGATRQDIDYMVIDDNPAPLPSAFWPGLNELWDLDAIDKMPTHEQMFAAVQDMQLSPSGAFFAQPQFPAPAPTPSQFPAPASMPPQLPAPAPQAQFPAPAPMPPQFPAPAPFQNFGQEAMPPALNPPPVQSSAPASGFAPQPSQPGSVAFPSAFAPPGGAPPATPAGFTQALPFPLPPGVTLPEGRERCYGNYHEGHLFCSQCPPGIFAQCRMLASRNQFQNSGR